ncbi:alkaline phosphatase [Halanaerobium saccharolyticum]|uniref:Alkaline phosphatase n=1 Tax=Halanaerobium saccharolyticum TaxID=43595 RepID=A0A4R7ZBE6_9FIRM|nr:alkaline phosphatase [Halanaerobium saccharolyticum]RAK11732.1 alkaline phosphatase [Halanaerobium saccharolyticum]TDW07573.1 alkaline phosphatase [Halanaerobium saccharolyticum]TDX64494.1 alkaline phosphatase [Halanaerobium saccharolyticum]
MKFTKRLVLFTSVLMIGLILSTAVIAFADDGAKYVFMFIGDGMANSQISAAEAFMSARKGEIGQNRLNFTTFPAQGMQTTYAADRFCGCSDIDVFRN